MTEPYNEHERDLVFIARLAESILARDWSRARAIWRQLAPLHARITPLQNLDVVLAYEEASERIEAACVDVPEPSVLIH